MKYFLQRDGRTYGPYSYDDLKRYQAENRIGPTDQVRREDSQQWEPWQQVLNPAAPAPAPVPQAPAMPPIQQGFGGYTPPAAPQPQPQQPAFGQPPQGFGGQPQQGFGQPPQQGFGGQPPAFGNNPPAYGGGFGQPPAEQGFGGFGQQPQAPKASDVPGAFGAFGAQGGFGGPPQGQPGGYGGQPYGQQGAPGGFGGQPMMPQQGGGYGGGVVGPMPPDMQWWLVALIGIFCGFFTLFWIFKQVTFVKKIDPQCQAGKFYLMGIGAMIGGYILMFMAVLFASGNLTELAVVFPMLGMVVVLAGVVCLYLGHFKMRASIHNYYTMVEPMGINLMDTSGALLTFFFSIYFFQFHFFNIAERKKAMGHPAV